MKISQERKDKRENMTDAQKQVESVLHHRDKNRDKVMAYQRQYAATARTKRREAAASQMIQ